MALRKERFTGSTKRAKLKAPALLDAARAITAVERVTYVPEPPRGDERASDSLGIATVLKGEARDGVLVTPGFMNETYGGGSLELVPGYDASPALTMNIAQPGVVAAHAARLDGPGAIWTLESVIGPDTRRPVPGTASLLCLRYSSATMSLTKRLKVAFRALRLINRWKAFSSSQKDAFGS